MALPVNFWRSLRSHLPAPLQNRFYLTLVIFLFILIFLDRHSLWVQWKLHRAQQRLQDDRELYEQRIIEAREEADDFELTKEKFAREHYFMKQRNEDVYIIKAEK